MHETGQLAARTLKFISKYVKEGVTTNELNNLCHDFIMSHDAYPAPLNYKGFPKSVCTSVNEVVCHGIPGEQKLKDGDIINIDVTTVLNDWYGDTSNMFLVFNGGSCEASTLSESSVFGESGESSVSDESSESSDLSGGTGKDGDACARNQGNDASSGPSNQESDALGVYSNQELRKKYSRQIKLMEVTKKALEIGIETAVPGNTFGDLGYAIQEFVESNGYSVVKDFCGHGIGKVFHTEPQVLHYGERGEGGKILPGMFFTIEPMVNEGTDEVVVSEKDGWTAITADNMLSAQYEHTIGITENGNVVFTRLINGGR